MDDPFGEVALRLPSFSSLLIGAFAVTIAVPDAQAAISVFGSSGTAKLCYDGAEGGTDAGAYIFYCDEALNSTLSPRDRAATFINRGVLRLLLNEVNFALADFNSGLAIDPSIGEGYIDRGASLIEKRQFTEAIQNIDKGLSLGAKKPGLAYYDRAIAHEALGDLPAAYSDYQQALVLQPDFSLASDELKRFKVVHKPVGS
jgi:tetratricopeptide (TPR) repeat protein